MEQFEYAPGDGGGAEPADWLPPGAALAHFEPVEGARPAVPGRFRKEERARYGFRVGELGLLIDPDTGSEVLTVSSITPLPDTPPGFLGLINVRGNLVPLYELGTLLGLGPRQPRTGTKALVFGKGEDAVGVAIDGYPLALTSLSQLQSLPSLPQALQAHVPAGYVQGEAVWLEFRHNSFFDEVCCGNGLAATAS
jgi:twitching motility protein PilI